MSRYKPSALESFHVMIDQDKDRKSKVHQRNHEGHIQIETAGCNENLIAQTVKGYKTLWKTTLFKSVTSGKRCLFVSKRSNQMAKETYLQNKHLENLERSLIHAESNYLSHFENRVAWIFQLNISENHRFKNEQSAKWLQFESSLTKESNQRSYQSIVNGDRIAQCRESERKFNQGSNVNKHPRNHFPENHYEYTQCADDFYQSSNIYIFAYGKNPYKYNEYSKALNQSSNDPDQRIHVG